MVSFSVYLSVRDYPKLCRVRDSGRNTRYVQSTTTLKSKVTRSMVLKTPSNFNEKVLIFQVCFIMLKTNKSHGSDFSLRSYMFIFSLRTGRLTIFSLEGLCVPDPLKSEDRLPFGTDGK